MLHFSNTEIAFGAKKPKDLRRAYWLFKVVSYPWIVKLAKRITPWMLRMGLPIKGIIVTGTTTFAFHRLIILINRNSRVAHLHGVDHGALQRRHGGGRILHALFVIKICDCHAFLYK